MQPTSPDEGPQASSSAEGTQQSSADDWLAGATVQAQAQDIPVGPLDISLEGLDLPDPSGPNVA